MTTISAAEFLKGGGTPQVVKPAVPDTTNANATPDGGSGSTIGDFGIGIVKGAADSAIQTTRMLQGAGQRVIAAVDPTRNLDQVRQDTGFKSLQGKDAAGIDEVLSAKTPAQKAGKVTETVGEFLLPFLGTEKAASMASKTAKVADETVNAVKDFTKGGASKAAKAIVGDTDAQIIKSSQNPMVDLFKTGKMKVQDVVSEVEGGINNFVKESKASLQAVKDAIPEAPIGAEKIADKVNKGIMDSIQHGADYRGVKMGLETPEDIIHSGVLTPEASDQVKKVVEFVSKWKDTSARGTLNLKEVLTNFWKNGDSYQGSNAVVRSIQRNLVDLVGQEFPEIKPALKTASENIDKTEEFTQHLFGKDEVSGESKLLTLARNLSDQAKNGRKIDLVKELEKVSGKNLMEQIQGVHDYLQAQKLKSPGLIHPLEAAKYAGKKIIQKTVNLK